MRPQVWCRSKTGGSDVDSDVTATLLLQSKPRSTVFRYDASYWTKARKLNHDHG